jgi:hypothetical protein
MCRFGSLPGGMLIEYSEQQQDRARLAFAYRLIPHGLKLNLTFLAPFRQIPNELPR